MLRGDAGCREQEAGRRAGLWQRLASSSALPAFIKFSWHIAVQILLDVVCGYFPNPTAGLSGFDRYSVAYKPKLFTIRPFK